MIDFIGLLKKVLVAEFGYSEPGARALCAKYSDIVINGLMSANNEQQLAGNLRPTAIALQMAEDEDRKGANLEKETKAKAKTETN